MVVFLVKVLSVHQKATEIYIKSGGGAEMCVEEWTLI